MHAGIADHVWSLEEIVELLSQFFFSLRLLGKECPIRHSFLSTASPDFLRELVRMPTDDRTIYCPIFSNESM